MNQVIKVLEGLGEIGIDTEASLGNGKYYVKHYISGYVVVGFETEAEALAELTFAGDI
jgi:hypothetical protein